MVCRLISGFSLCLCAALGAVIQVSADGAETNAATLQDQPRVLPEENAAFFAASDRRIRFQLMKLGDSPASLLAGTPVTVIDPRGRSTRLTADSKGVAILSNAAPGLHAVVAAGPAGHVAVPVVLREQAADENAGDLAGADIVADGGLATVDLPLLDARPGAAMRVANSFLPPPTAGTLADIDRQRVRESEIGEGHNYRVRSAAGGRVAGRVYSLLRPDATNGSLNGTTLMVYRGNQVVARATTDEEGRFEFENLQPGVHGLIAAGPVGYAAFAFEVVEAQDVVRSVSQKTLVTTSPKDANAKAHLASANQPPAGAGSLPVMVVPTPMVPGVLEAMRADADAPTPLEVGLGPVAPGFAPPGGAIGGAMGGPGGGFGGGAGGGFGGGAGGGGTGAGIGAGGLLGLAGVAAAAAAASRGRSDRAPVPPVATPARPTSPPGGPPFTPPGPP